MIAPFLILFAALIWASDSLVRLPLSTFLGGARLVLLENGIALALALSIGLILWFKGRLGWRVKVSTKDWFKFILLGVAGSALGNHFYTRSIELLGASAPNLFLMIQPVVVLVLARYFLKERQSSFFYQLSIWIIVNAVVIAFPDLSFGFEVKQEGDLGLGALYGLGASFAYAVSTVIGKDLVSRHPPVVLVVLRSFFALAVVTFSQSYESTPLTWTLVSAMQLFYVTAGVGVGGMMLYYYGLRSVPASFAAFVELIYPLGGIFIPVIATGGELSPVQAIGAIALMMALFLQWKATEKNLF